MRASSRPSAAGSSPVRRSSHDPSSAATRPVSTVAVVVRGDRREAAAADRGHDRPLGLDTAPRLRVVGRADEMLLARAHLQRERALRRLRQQLVRLEAMADLAGRGRAGRGRTPRARSRRARARRACAAACRCCRAAARSRASARARAAARAAAPTRCRSRMPGRTASAPQSASRGSSRARYAPTTRPSGSDEVMSFAECTATSMRCVEQRLLELLHEDAARADLAERLRPVAVAGGRDRHERDLDPRARAGATPRARPA